MIAVIDNYDSFTYNLVQYLGMLGAEIEVHRNDAITVDALAARPLEGLVISPGPGEPRDAGITEAAIAKLAGRVPVLGVCLGHQGLAEVYGGKVVRAQRLMHGKTSPILHRGRGLFAGLDNPFEATRYHSLIVERDSLPATLELVAWTPEGEIMGLKHREHETWGVQFHPESVLTLPGLKLIENFLTLCRQGRERHAVIQTAIGRAVQREGLTRDLARASMEQVLAGEATPAQIAALAIALRMKGETPEEIAGMAEAMRMRVPPIRTRRSPLLDTCGTGGDNAGTFNISTTVAIVTASCGVAVAKHGNRAVSSRTGSADVLESLGAPIDLTAESAARSIDLLGITFLFAPNYHTALRHAAGPRREMGVRTVFNVLGPLTNPAGATRQLLGVYADSLVRTVAEVLLQLGSERAWVVHGRDGLDELTVFAKSHVAELDRGALREFEVDPASLGLAHTDRAGVAGGDAATNAARVRSILRGDKGAGRDIVLLNTAAALLVAGTAASLEDGVKRAAAAIDGGQAAAKLAELVAFRS